MSTKYIVDNLSGQTITGQPILRPYKSYTALLTQSGNSSNQQNITSGDLTIGVTYLIDDYDGQPDFTNVGAPNNNAGTFFVATGTTPNSWGFHTNLIYYYGAPVATVLENTIGNIWFEYGATGIYNVNSNSLFTLDKTAISIDTYGQDGGYSAIIAYRDLDSTHFRIVTNKKPEGDSDNILYKNTLKITVYN